MRNLLENVPGPSASLIIDKDFDLYMYLDPEPARKRFQKQAERIIVLDPADANWSTKLGYGYKGANQEILATFYHIMFQNIFGSSLVIKNDILAVRFQWYVHNNQLDFHLLSVKEVGDLIPPAVEINGLYEFLRNAPDNSIFVQPIKSNDILRRLGFAENELPSDKNIIFDPVIVDKNGKSYFALATKVTSGSHSHAYGPPCPTECYPPR